MNLENSQTRMHVKNNHSNEIEKYSPTVMIVDDEPFILLTLGSLLTRLGCKVDKAPNGKVSLDMVKEKITEGKQYDLIFMDANMPIMNGYEAALEITKDTKVKTPIICVSAQDSIQHKEKCMKSGMRDIISKPCTIAKLEEILKKYKLI